MPVDHRVNLRQSHQRSRTCDYLIGLDSEAGACQGRRSPPGTSAGRADRSGNGADNAVYTAEKTLRDFGDKVPADLKSKVESGVTSVREAMNGEDANAIRRATDELMQSVQQIGAAAYQQSGPEAGPSESEGPKPGGEGGEGSEDVVEGEFRNE
jgi:hypothetical protein